MNRQVPILLPPDDELRHAHPSMWGWYDEKFPHPQHPVASRLTLAYVRRLSHLYAPPDWKSPRFSEGPLARILDQEKKPYWLTHAAEFRRFYSELRDLLSRMPPRPLNITDAVLLRHTRQALREQGLSDDENEQLLRKSTGPRRGAPPAKRVIAVEALESKLQHLEFGWADLVRLYCDCEKSEHDSYCEESMRLAIHELRQVLNKYGVPVRVSFRARRFV